MREENLRTLKGLDGRVRKEREQQQEARNRTSSYWQGAECGFKRFRKFNNSSSIGR